MPFNCIEHGDSLEMNGLGELEVNLATDSGLEIVAGEGLSIVSTGVEWWEELGRTTLGANAATITVSGFAARKYLLVLYNFISSGATAGVVRFNSDGGTNYSQRYSQNFAAPTSLTSQSGISTKLDAAATTQQGTINIVNILAQEKLVTVGATNQQAAGAGNAPAFEYVAGKWANTAAQITRMDFITSANNYASGSGVVVLGHD